MREDFGGKMAESREQFGVKVARGVFVMGGFAALVSGCSGGAANETVDTALASTEQVDGNAVTTKAPATPATEPPATKIAESPTIEPTEISVDEDLLSEEDKHDIEEKSERTFNKYIVQKLNSETGFYEFPNDVDDIYGCGTEGYAYLPGEGKVSCLSDGSPAPKDFLGVDRIADIPEVFGSKVECEDFLRDEGIGGWFTDGGTPEDDSDDLCVLAIGPNSVSFMPMNDTFGERDRAMLIYGLQVREELFSDSK